MTDPPHLPAGGFTVWLSRTRMALVEESGAEVPCGSCVACCASSHFVHVRPEESETLARIPRELLFPAPGLPDGNVLMGYDETGHCPMLVDNVCSIYPDRPLTCRTYDCRVFAAAGIAADRPQITQRTRRWRFSYPTQDDRDRQAAVKAAARFVRQCGACFPGGTVPADPTHVALLAVKVYDVFLDAPTASDTIAALVEARERFEAGRPVAR